MGADTYEEGKIFVGGLNQDSTKESLRRHFQSFGTMTDCVVMHDQATGRSRGFGFVTFENAEAVDRLLATPQIVDGKEVDCKRACPRDSTNARQNGPAPFRTTKIFVGGLPDISKEEFQQYFEKFGRVSDAVLMQDKNNSRPRGFGFITFESKDVVDEVIRKYHDHYIKAKWVEVKKAQPKEQMIGMRPPFGAMGASPPKWNAFPQGYDNYHSYRGGGAAYNPYERRGPYGGVPGLNYDPYGAAGFPAGGQYGGVDASRGRNYSPYGQGGRGAVGGGYGNADPYSGSQAAYGVGYSSQGAAGNYGPPAAAAGYSSSPYGAGASPYGGGGGAQAYANGRSSQYAAPSQHASATDGVAAGADSMGDGYNLYSRKLDGFEDESLADGYNPYSLYANYGPQRVASRGAYQRSYPY